MIIADGINNLKDIDKSHFIHAHIARKLLPGALVTRRFVKVPKAFYFYLGLKNLFII
jgi:hypothetical protein